MEPGRGGSARGRRRRSRGGSLGSEAEAAGHTSARSGIRGVGGSGLADDRMQMQAPATPTTTT
eukprot:CAMPEP_0113531310 /NCGR_PEP_ID=MMETSP0015_2-20120614/3427_1 /TAXON_ID=2838 /ORGANISM="Odontella" /LENGTH=62 /DNA_ID=CAMNT_0000430135 /DNA_START=281 /DNA_END=465 /DNA_ORIENTATION=+ /assembly_acc=CAM_ASM_000160